MSIIVIHSTFVVEWNSHLLSTDIYRQYSDLFRLSCYYL